jgi:hypothetical protein
MERWLHEEEECGHGLTQDAHDVNAHNIQWLYHPVCSNSFTILKLIPFYDRYNLYTFTLQTTMGMKSFLQG